MVDCSCILTLYIFLIDEDGNGNIDMEELKKCLQKLQLNLKEEEVEDLFHSCDIDQSEGIQFNEFIVLLCLIYLLVEHSSSPLRVSTINSTLPSFNSFDVNMFTYCDQTYLMMYGFVSDLKDRFI